MIDASDIQPCIIEKLVLDCAAVWIPMQSYSVGGFSRPGPDAHFIIAIMAGTLIRKIQQ